MKRIVAAVLTLFTVLFPVSITAFAEKAAAAPGAPVVSFGIFGQDGLYNINGGIVTGFGAEYLSDLKTASGLSIDYSYENEDQDLSAAMSDLLSGKVDMIAGVPKSATDDPNIIFSDEYIAISHMIITCLSGNMELGRDNPGDLSGRTVGLVRGSYINNIFTAEMYVRGLRVTTRYYSNAEELYSALENHYVDAIAAPDSLVSPGELLLLEYKLAPLYVAAINDKEHQQLMKTVNEANRRLQDGSPMYFADLYEQYFMGTLNEPTVRLELTPAEQNFVDSAAPITIAYPGSSVYGGKFSGDSKYFVKDLVTLLSKRTGLRILERTYTNIQDAAAQLAEGDVDVVAGVPDQRRLYANSTFSMPYYVDSVTALAHRNIDLNKEGLKITFAEGTGQEEQLQKLFSAPVVTRYGTYTECIEAVNSGVADLTIVDSRVAELLLLSPDYTNVVARLVPNLTRSFTFAVSNVRDPALLQVINKGISMISQHDVENMLSDEKVGLARRLSGGGGGTNLFVGSEGLTPAAVVLILTVVIVVALIIIRHRRKIAAERAERSNFDALTGGLSYQTFLTEAQGLLDYYKQDVFAILKINVNGFKYLTDLFSQSYGDDLLKSLAGKIESVLGPNGVYSRTTADNFFVIMRVSNQVEIIRFFSALHKEAESLFVSGGGTTTELCCGIFTYTPDLEFTVPQMIESAGIALRRALASGAPYVFFEEKMALDAVRESEVVRTMYEALQNEEFTFYLQPQHHLKKKDKVLSAEALVRWIKPDGTVIPPNDFIPIFEHNGFVVELDRYTFECVCRFIKEHMDDDWFDKENFTIAVNVSKLDLFKSDFLEKYIGMKTAYGIPDHCIELEFTESLAFDDYSEFKKMLQKLSAAGFSTSLDDFGAGSSSLNVLKELDVDVLKMDRLFFVGEDGVYDQRNNSVISSVIAMARGLGMKIVAEGIESSEQITFLRRIGCDIVQGFVYSRPLPQDEFIEYVRNHKGFGGFAFAKSGAAIAMEQLDRGGEKDVLGWQKYISTLNFVRALVLEADLDRDVFTLASLGGGEYSFPSQSGSYSDQVLDFLRGHIAPEDINVISSLSTQNLTACFYRGDASLTFEFRFATYIPELERFSEEYDWHELTVCRIETDDPTTFMSMIFMRNVQERYDKDAEHRKSLDLLSMAIKGLRGQIYEVDLDEDRLTVVHSNKGEDRITLKNGPVFEQIAMFSAMYVHSADRHIVNRVISEEFIDSFFESESDRYVLEYRRKNSQGQTVWKSASLIKNSERSRKVLLLVQDITSQKSMEEQLQNTERRFGGLIDGMYTIVLELDLDHDSLTVIKSVVRQYWAMDGMSINNARSMFAGNLRIVEEYSQPLENLYSDESLAALFRGDISELNFDFEIIEENGEREWRNLVILRENVPGRMAIMFVRDITDAKKKQLGRTPAVPLGERDPLTDVLTINSVAASASAYLAGEGETGRHMLAVLDVDGFSELNARFGHTFGDMLLCDIALRLKNRLGGGAGNLIGRAGGDEFLIFIADVDMYGDTETALAVIRDVFKQSFDAGAGALFVSGSVGAAVFPDHGGDFDDLYRNAQCALAASKKIGSGLAAVYDTALERGAHGDAAYAAGSRIESAYSFNSNIVVSVFHILYEPGGTEQKIGAILSYIGTHLGLSRVYLIDCPEGQTQYRQHYEWTGDGAVRQPDEWEFDFEYGNRFYNADDLFTCEDVSQLAENDVVR